MKIYYIFLKPFFLFIFVRYLFECLYSWLITTLSQAESFILEHEQSQESKGGRAANKKNKKKKKSRPHAKEITHAQAMHELCGGYYKVSKPQNNYHNLTFNLHSVVMEFAYYFFRRYLV